MSAIDQSQLSTDECRDLAKVLSIKYGAYLGDRSFAISCTGNAETCLISVVLSNVDQTFFYPVEARAYLADSDLAFREAALTILDYIDMYFEEYFREEEELFISIDWSPHQDGDLSFELRGQVKNYSAEKTANELLGETVFQPV